jgi:hypothetical protein
VRSAHIGGLRRGGVSDGVAFFVSLSPSQRPTASTWGSSISSSTSAAWRLEGKYFSTTAEGASQYGRMAVRGFGDAPYTIVETTMPNGTAPLAPFVDRGIPTVVVPNTALPVLARPIIWPFMPIP